MAIRHLLGDGWRSQHRWPASGQSVLPPSFTLDLTAMFVRAVLDLMTEAQSAAKDVVSPAFFCANGTAQSPPTPAGPEMGSLRPGRQARRHRSSSHRPRRSPSQRMRVFSIRMLCLCCSTDADTACAFTTSSLAFSFFHLNSAFGGIGPSRLNQQRLPSMSRHHQWIPVHVPAHLGKEPLRAPPSPTAGK